MFLRVLLIVAVLGSSVSLEARGRKQAYQAGGGAHRAAAKQRSKQPKEKPVKKPSPPPEARHF